MSRPGSPVGAVNNLLVGPGAMDIRVESAIVRNEAANPHAPAASLWNPLSITPIGPGAFQRVVD
jgi:hypothetical protein